MAFALHRGGDGEFHGFALARLLRERAGARQLTAHGTLYKALGRLEQRDLLSSQWEHPEVAAAESRPRRRVYTITGEGQRVAAQASVPGPLPSFRPASGRL